MAISIIIPTYNEEENIGRLVTYLKTNGGKRLTDIIIADGGSTDNTLQNATAAGATAAISPLKGRAAQMNFGASLGKGNILYFVHADVFPPPNFAADIELAISNGYGIGRYRTKFDSDRFILKINAWFTRFDLFICMGGDQTLFVAKNVFNQCHGFNDDMKIMEEYEFCERARKLARYQIMKNAALISARKYHTNGWLRVQLANSKVVSMYRKGAPQQDMINQYKRMLRYRQNAF